MIRASISRIGRRAISYVRRLGPRGLILVYHRIAETGVDPWQSSVTPQHFAEHLEVLGKHWKPMALRQFVEAQQGGAVTDRSVVITFDDGYANHRHTVLPLLEQFDIPATFFISTGQLGTQREYWWDELEGLLTGSEPLPPHLSLVINGKPQEYEIIECEYGDEQRRRDRQLHAWEGHPGTRLALYYSLWEQLRVASADEQRRVMDALLAWAGKVAFPRESYRPLSVAELKAMSSSRCVEIGAHTVTHPVLRQISSEQQQKEVVENQRDLQRIVGGTVDSFAFPYGIFTDALVENLRGMGFSCACSTAGGPVRRRTNRFLLPRETVSDWDGEEFSRQLNAWYASGS